MSKLNEGGNVARPFINVGLLNKLPIEHTAQDTNFSVESLRIISKAMDNAHKNGIAYPRMGGKFSWLSNYHYGVQLKPNTGLVVIANA